MSAKHIPLIESYHPFNQFVMLITNKQTILTYIVINNITHIYEELN